MANALRTEHLVQAGRAPGIQAQNALQVKRMHQDIEQTEYRKSRRGVSEEYEDLRNEALAQGNQQRVQAIDEVEYLKSRRPFKEESEAWEWMSKVTPLLTLDNFNEFRDRAIQWGISPELLITRDKIDHWAKAEGIAPEQSLEEFKLWSGEQLRIIIAQTARMKAGKGVDKSFTLSAGQARYDAEGNIIAEGPEKQPTGQLTESQQKTEYQRLRNQVARSWGYSEFSKLDEDVAKKVEQATVLAREYYDQGENMDAAIKRANNEVRLQYSAKEIPQANKGLSNNKKQTARLAKGLSESGMNVQAIIKALTQKGWTTEEAREILKMAGISDEGGQAQYLQTATNPKTGEKVGLTKEGRWVRIQ